MDIELKMDEREWDQIVNFLARGPFSWAETNPLISKLVQQMQEKRAAPAQKLKEVPRD
jgi:hypothetical protein